ncbi:MAG: uroporphyrinogen-III synthase [Thermoplasmata archaeon]|jgi:uroporphyrinogen-III synthase|nr:uroporphyrinogen-III synthase [Thermoplasmata archaeon]
MAPVRPNRTIALLSAAGTLAGIDTQLERAGVRVARISTLEFSPVPPEHWRSRIMRGRTFDTVVATSRTGVAAGVVPWLRTSGPRVRSCEFWAVGPGTAAALREAGVRVVRRPRLAGTPALARALRRTEPRTILYFRSDRAGPGLARSLRRMGHRVSDVVVYRVASATLLTARDRRRLAAATLWVATSPSSLASLSHGLPAPTWNRLRDTATLVVLGERSRRAAIGLGVRRVSVVPVTTTQRFTRRLLRELDHVGP